MKTKDGIMGVFRMFVGDGTYHGIKFDLCVTTTPAGDLTGMPIVSFKDDDGKTIGTACLELEEVLDMAAEALGIEVKT